MDHEFEYGFGIKPNVKRNHTYIWLKIPLSTETQDFQHLDWESYCRACRASLHAVATQHGLEIIESSVDFDESCTCIYHSVAVRGVLFGVVPLHIVRALRPSSAYRTLAFLARAVRKDWRTGSTFLKAIEAQKLCRYDRHGKELPESIASQLLIRAITETHWQSLIGPSDKPWAYINTATRRIYRRHYQTEEDCNGGTPADERYDATDSGDELHIADVPKTLRAAGLTNDAITVLNAKAQGRRSELRSNLMDCAGKPMSPRQVEALRGKIRRGAKRLRAAAIAASTWRPRLSSAMVYRERVPDGELWQGLWTYSHKYQGEELELLRLVMFEERENLFTNYP
jgi:hypothetical protein